MQLNFHNYKITVIGENFLIHIDGKQQKINFCVAKLISAKNKEEAEEGALLEVKEDLENKTLNDKKDPPMMYISNTIFVISKDSSQLNHYYWNIQSNQKN